MKRLLIKTCLLVAFGSFVSDSLFAAEMAIEIEVALAPGVPITAPQVWAERLGKLGLDRVQIRSARGEEQPSTEMNDSGTRITVIAVLTRGDVLVVPQRKFRAGQIAELREYFANLQGQIAEEGIERGLFRLTQEEFNTVLVDMSRPLGISTKGEATRDLLTHCSTQFRLPIKQEASAAALLRSAKPLECELETLAAGTALAVALRREGLTIRPEHIPGGLQLVVAPYVRGEEAWPTGWKAKESPRQLAPKLFEALTIEIDGYTLASALTALEPRLTVPVVMDEWVLAEQKIRPNEIQVKLAPKKTFLKNAVDKLLSQARLASELRIDDRGSPFLWVTQYGPDSRPAQ